MSVEVGLASSDCTRICNVYIVSSGRAQQLPIPWCLKRGSSMVAKKFLSKTSRKRSLQRLLLGPAALTRLPRAPGKAMAGLASFKMVGKCGGALVHDLKSIATDGTPGLHLRQFHH